VLSLSHSWTWIGFIDGLNLDWIGLDWIGSGFLGNVMHDSVACLSLVVFLTGPSTLLE